jgi:kinesin family protein 2/24
MHTDSQRAGGTSNANASNTSESIKPDTVLGRLGLMSGLTSRDLDPTATTVPFKDRIRPGMVVSWHEHPDRGSALSTLDVLELAVVLCPVAALHGNVKDVHGNVVNPLKSKPTSGGEPGTGISSRYLCALLTPGLMAEAYELNLWQQIVIDVRMMDKEVFLEYDGGTRYYYISV